MPQWKPDPTFYPSPSLAMESPAERLAYVALLNVRPNGHPDALGVVDVDPASRSYGRLVGQVEFPHGDNELHHFGWNACSSCLCPYSPHPHVERRYLIVPGIHSSRIHVVDTRPDPRRPELIKVIDGETLHRKTGYAAPHTVHCGPDGVYMNALGAPSGKGPGGLFMLDAKTFDVLGPWEQDRGPQHLAYDFFWHLGHDTMLTSEWGTPEMVNGGVVPELLLQGKYGHALHVWDLRSREHRQTIDLGKEQQMVLELRPAHNPLKAWGFVGVVISIEDLSASVFLWYRDERAPRGAEWVAKKVITIPAEPADPADLPPLLKGFKAVPPLITDINLSVDDRFLYVSCWGTGELRQYDVSDPFNPRLISTVRIGGITRRAPHPSSPNVPRNGGPQMVEVSRDGHRVYVTNSLYSPWDAQFYPDGIEGWMVKLDTRVQGGMELDPHFFLPFGSGMRAHQVRLEGGDASSDSFCYS